MTTMKLTELPKVDDNQDSDRCTTYHRRALVANIFQEEHIFGSRIPYCMGAHFQQLAAFHGEQYVEKKGAGPNIERQVGRIGRKMEPGDLSRLPCYCDKSGR